MKGRDEYAAFETALKRELTVTHSESAPNVDAEKQARKP
jgi:hypothetical protein